MPLQSVLFRYDLERMWRRGKRIYSRYGYESLGSRVTRIFRRFYGYMRGDRFSFHKSVSELNSLKKSEESVADIVDTAYYYKGYGKFHTLRPRQVRNEIETLAEMVADVEPTFMLEIGTERGGTFYIWNRLLDEPATIISIDLPEGTTDSIPYDRFLKAFAEDDGRIKLIRGNSQNTQTIDEVYNVLDGEKLDFLFIDTEFSYDNVQSDFENYTSLVCDGGLVAIHDIYHPEGSVDDFWKEIHSSDQYNTKEIVCSSKLRDYNLGIGVVYI